MAIKRITMKEEFIKFVNQMEEPILYIGNDDLPGEVLNKFFLIKDNKDRNKVANLPGCRLKTGYLAQDDLDKYYRKEKTLTDKYERWFYEVRGEHYEIRNI